MFVGALPEHQAVSKVTLVLLDEPGDEVLLCPQVTVHWAVWWAKALERP
jgi:hypothetical protein